MERILPLLRLSLSPLLLVLAQVRFSPILQMDRFIPSIQERFRNEGFPKFQAMQSTTIQIPGIPAVSQNPTVYWEFMDREDKKSIVIGTESIAFSVSDYSTFEDFRVGLQIALLTVQETVKLELRTRLGLRYVNLIIPEKGKRVSDYVHAEILGLSRDELPLQRLAYGSQLVCKSEIGRFTLRCAHQIGGLVLPLDLQLIRLALNKPRVLDQEFCVLDFDHSVEQQSDFDLAAVSTAFHELNTVLDQGFRAAVTPEALKEWE
jgi:uncharacterized protein (TIGR04255 family)